MITVAVVQLTGGSFKDLMTYVGTDEEDCKRKIVEDFNNTLQDELARGFAELTWEDICTENDVMFSQHEVL